MGAARDAGHGWVAVRCGVRLARRGRSFCGACGAPVPGQGALVAERVDQSGAAEPEARGDTIEPVGPGRRRWWVGGVMTAAPAAVAVSGDRRATGAGTTLPFAIGTTSSPAPMVPLGRGPLLGEPTGLTLLLTATEQVQRLDLDARTLRPLPIDADEEQLWAVPGGFVAARGGRVELLDHQGAERSPGARPIEGTVLGVDASGSLVIQSAQDAEQLRRVPAGASRAELWLLPLPAGLRFDISTMRVDAAGGLVVAVQGGVVRVTSAGATPVASGALLDARGRFVVTWSCFPGPGCALEVTDVTASVAPASVPAAAGRRVFAARVSPDGRFVLREEQLTDQSLTPVELVRVVDGVVVARFDDASHRWALPYNGGADRVAWSPDGRWLFVTADEHRLLAWRDGRTVPIIIDVSPASLQGPVIVELA